MKRTPYDVKDLFTKLVKAYEAQEDSHTDSFLNIRTDTQGSIMDIDCLTKTGDGRCMGIQCRVRCNHIGPWGYIKIRRSGQTVLSVKADAWKNPVRKFIIKRKMRTALQDYPNRNAIDMAMPWLNITFWQIEAYAEEGHTKVRSITEQTAKTVRPLIMQMLCLLLDIVISDKEPEMMTEEKEVTV